MSAVEIRAYAAAAATGESDALDTSGFSTLRLNLRRTADTAFTTWLQCYIETRASTAAAWRTVWEKRFTANGADVVGVERIVLSDHDALTRLRWAAGSAEPNYPQALALVLGLDGIGLPDPVEEEP